MATSAQDWDVPCVVQIQEMARKARLDRNEQGFAGKMEKTRTFVPWVVGDTCFLLEES